MIDKTLTKINSVIEKFEAIINKDTTSESLIKIFNNIKSNAEELIQCLKLIYKVEKQTSKKI